MGRLVSLTIDTGYAPGRIGGHLFDRFNRDLRKVAWQGRVAFSSRYGEISTPVPDLFTIQLMTGLLDQQGGWQPAEMRVPAIFFVEPVCLPQELRGAELERDCSYVGFLAEMFKQDGKHYRWTGGVNLEQIAAAGGIKEELLRGIDLRMGSELARTLAATMLVNLSGPDQAPRSAAELSQQIAGLRQQMVRLARA
ncbi:MAG: hypothetical protein JW782_07475 [Candidatus Saganbacteria bacterium]|nr:hypothetical protein [Candidatus Saganbacteria bacterium]